MRTLTLIAVATIIGGVYHYRQRRGLGAKVRERKLSADQQLARRVQTAIEGAVANPGRVNVKVTHGVVALRGEVRKPERDLVLAAALGVPGVTRVTNLLETDEPTVEVGTMQSGIAEGV